jgi:hypothetical protein
MESAFVSGFSDAMQECNEENVLGVFRALLLIFRKVHDDGINLSTDILKRIDILIVTFGPPEVSSTALFSRTLLYCGCPGSVWNTLQRSIQWIQ